MAIRWRLLGIMLGGLFLLSLANSCTFAQKPSQYKLFWPPQLNGFYPELELMSSTGKKVKLSSFAGKVILVEPIGMSCPACQAFAGASKKGGFQGVNPQPGIPSIDELLTQQGVSPSDSRLVKVQLILYSPSLNAPSLEQAQAWSRHFGFGQRPNEVILIGDARFINDASYNMIPGFQLIDKSYVLRSDSSGHNPKNDLYRELLPMVKKIL